MSKKKGIMDTHKLFNGKPLAEATKEDLIESAKKREEQADDYKIRVGLHREELKKREATKAKGR